jgi:hypothetical protein
MKYFALALLASPVAAAGEPAPICTDRPTKANALCTVPAGRLQLETSAVGWSLTKLDGSRSELLTIGSSFAKIGLSDRSDLQVGFTPYVRLTVKQDGSRNRVSGFGDVVVRYKRRLTSDAAKLQVGVIPFVKLPTAADGLGNGKAEGGLAVPISFPAGAATLTLGPELDLIADADGGGRYFGLINLVNLALPVAPRLTFAGEIWTNFNFDPAGTAKQASADAALAYALSNGLQLDAGANLGLTRDTPDLELYGGLSVGF